MHNHNPRRLLLTQASANGSSSSNNADNGGGGDDFDTNMVIILVALLCALVCAVALNSVARFVLRCARRSSGGAAAPAVSMSGLDKTALKQIPVAVYGGGMQIPATDCSICLGELRKGEKVRVLPRCRHGFHVGCIDKWLGLHSSCPVCRQPLDRPGTATVEIR